MKNRQLFRIIHRSRDTTNEEVQWLLQFQTAETRAQRFLRRFLDETQLFAPDLFELQTIYSYESQTNVLKHASTREPSHSRFTARPSQSSCSTMAPYHEHSKTVVLSWFHASTGQKRLCFITADLRSSLGSSLEQTGPKGRFPLIVLLSMNKTPTLIQRAKLIEPSDTLSPACTSNSPKTDRSVLDRLHDLTLKKGFIRSGRRSIAWEFSRHPICGRANRLRVEYGERMVEGSSQVSDGLWGIDESTVHFSRKACFAREVKDEREMDEHCEWRKHQSMLSDWSRAKLVVYGMAEESCRFFSADYWSTPPPIDRDHGGVSI